ncbi:unnamed protein product [Schistocephalus solidus]|uniref:MYND-type domain-containing protein n=1 Tax=Schistocephalus solidus TaxID=70667 RepID=A0A183SJK1_SCHSO|nr:unnamed protein product [Schistocephalus solidus]
MVKLMLKPGRSFKRGDIIVTDTTLAHALSESETANYCAYCVTASDHLLRCSQCSHVYYCNRQCQKAGWAFGHRGECKLIAKAGKFPSATLRLLLALITTGARISYIDTMIPTEERRKDLQSRYFFRCGCELCEDTQQDLAVRIPACCGKERLMGPRPAPEYLSDDTSRLIVFPPRHLRLLPSLKPQACLDPEEVFVCGRCDKVYAAPVLEAFQKRVYEAKEYSDALELYKACVAADQNENSNPYFRLFFRHQDSMLMTRLCRTVIAKCTCWEDQKMDEDADLVLDCGARTIQWLQAHTNMQYQFICSVSLAYLIYLSNSIFLLQERLGPQGRPPCRIYNLPRLNRFTEAFLSAAPALVPCIRSYALHVPSVADDLAHLREFAQNLNLSL